MQVQMTLDILLNPSVPAEDEMRLSRQANCIWQLFRARERMGLRVLSVDLMKIAGQYQARLYEIRRALIPRGYCIDEQRGKGGINYYKIVPLSKSTFFAKRKEQLGHLVNANRL